MSNSQEITTMTLKELISLDKEGKLIPYPARDKAVWTDEMDNDFLDTFKHSDLTGDFFILNLTQEGIYQILDGKHRISLLLEFGKLLDAAELDTYIKRLNFSIQKNMTINGINNYFMYKNNLPLTEAECRKGYIIQENRDLLEKLVSHDFFKNCKYQGCSNDMSDWDCMEILIAFLRCDFTDADKATLPSSLEKYNAMKVPYEQYIINKPFSILSFMEIVFKGKDYVCRAIDFCCMAILLNKYETADIDEDDVNFNEDYFTESQFQTLYEEYVKMWNKLEPCVTLNPLANENLGKITNYIGLILDKVWHGEDSILSYRE
jgi:hypothetical protein